MRPALPALLALLTLLVLPLTASGSSRAEPTPGLPRPAGLPSPEADAAAAAMQAAVGIDGWERTGAVRWVFNGKRRHLWDRRRGLARVGWPEADGRQVEVWLEIGSRRGIAARDGAPVAEPEAAGLVEQAYAAWINDGFWLYPFDRFGGPEVERSVVDLPVDPAAPGDPQGGPPERGLLVRWLSGGLTPGDAYLWRVGADGRPAGWWMWVSVIPEGGVPVSWEGWEQLSTGAWVSTLHRFPSRELRLTEVEGATQLRRLEATDPFGALLGEISGDR